MTGRHVRIPANHVYDMIGRIESGKYEEPLKQLMAADMDTLRKLYVDREFEPYPADEMWEPDGPQYL